MSDRLEPTDHGQHACAEDRALKFRSMREVTVPMGAEIFQQSMLGYIDWRLRKFDMLNDFKIASGLEPQTLNLLNRDFVHDNFIDLIGRQRLTQMALVPALGSKLRV